MRSTRRTRTITAQNNSDGSVRLLVPARASQAEINDALASLLPRLERQRTQRTAARERFASDEYLVQRAEFLMNTYLPELLELSEEERPVSIRWVSNQRTRWGSATPAVGRIRISDQLQGAPEYVVDSVLHHELCHFIEMNHNQRFRALEKRFPEYDKAQAFLGGMTFAASRITD
ncbi:MAG: DUF45 domain-containing protein [Rothia sp. (in: high G+C Gram-positive bacteria)]|uniref:M48 metallopeptidase family protein n=1 Tax=Rothia sp. (in: high G+C Gram-positive bacteria) TaxID=1885016 RepID=UPI0026DEC6BD|nr:M48 family metallopeptidase [Rothia sp. (in: high G+C Gram-positive bacteria)]MDO5751074.1 DUF45 domain-containing protein [Rothia sp. (in: high G+C Gram-positive bacteria)]